MVTLNLRDDCNGRVATNFKRGMTDKRFLELEITAWLTSPERKKQLEGEAYYDGYQDVTHRERLALDEDGKPVVLKNLPNNRLVNNLYSKMVDQKTNYSFGRPLSFDTENKEYAKALGALFGARFLRTMHNVGEGAWIGGKSWLYPYYENGELAFRRFPADEVLPFWADADHTVLDAAVHVYVVQEYDEAEHAKDVVKVEVMHGGGVDCFIRTDDGVLEPDSFAYSGPYIITQQDDETGKVEGYNWERIPLVCFKSSHHEIPLLSKVKCLQDAYSNQLDYVDAAARKMYEGSYYHTAFELQKGLGVGWTMQAINEETITKVLSRPWTTDNQTFRDRCWTNKQSLVNSVNTQLTQMVIRGEAPDRAISAISKQFDVSRAKAGRLVMTESAYFSSAGQKDCYKALDVERYKIVASFDKDTCSLCADMDGKVFKMSEYQVGLTAPPFHPWCRCCTCPYFEDMDGMGERYARDAVTGERFKVPGNMTYDQWKAQQDALHGQGTVDKMRKISYNETTDRAQFEKYRERLGADAPRYFKDFQALKYDHAAEYKDLAGLYSYKGRVPEASKADYKAYEAVKATGVPGSVRVPAKPIEVDELVFKDAHGTHHGCTLEDAKGYIRQAKCSITRKRWDGYHTNYYSFEGAAYMDDESGKINTAFSKSDFDPKTKEIMEVFE